MIDSLSCTQLSSSPKESTAQRLLAEVDSGERIVSFSRSSALFSLDFDLEIDIERSMEEVWKDFPNLHHHLTHPPVALDHHHRPTTTPLQGINLQDFLTGSPRGHHAPPLTTLSLHSGHIALEPATPLPCKRPSDPSPVSGAPDGGGVRLKQRMIKNRESAARSRARKQAYINELEMEVAHLAQENAVLRRQHHELKAAMADQAPAKGKLQRTSSAPF